MRKIKILGINGSPREKATFFAVQKALEAAAEVEGVETELISLSRKSIGFCVHCNGCIKDGVAANCIVHNDDMTEIFEKFKEADGYIIASPVYNMNITGQLCTFFNRFRSSYIEVRDNQYFNMDKVGGAIAVGGTRNGGQEIVIDAIMNFYNTEGITTVNGGMVTYTGACIWSKDKGKQGVIEDTIGLNNAKIIGKKVALLSKKILR